MPSRLFWYNDAYCHNQGKVIVGDAGVYSGAACARAFMRGCKGAFGAMLAHVPKDALDVGVVNQGLLHHLDALAVGVRVTCTGGSDRLAYACSGGGVWMWCGLRCR